MFVVVVYSYPKALNYYVVKRKSADVNLFSAAVLWIVIVVVALAAKSVVVATIICHYNIFAPLEFTAGTIRLHIESGICVIFAGMCHNLILNKAK